MTEDSSAADQNPMLNYSSLVLFFKGIAMGLGDSVPGVSGGTIAVITNIYERLIFAILSIDGRAVKILFAMHFAKFWQHIDGNFLLLVVLGALTGLIISAHTVLFLLTSYPEPLMAFFIGLILASTWILRSQYERNNYAIWAAILFGVGVAVLVGNLEPRIANANPVYVFICGAIGICAMILPGLSGAFILLLLGVYQFILTALVQFDVLYIIVFASGCIVGLLSFSRVLAWLLKNYHNLTFGFISGMLLGSVYVLWPWRQAISFYIDSSGIQHPLQTVKIWPLNYTEITGNPSWLAISLISFVGGIAVVVLLHSIFNKKDAANV
ncbi:MAG: DUF368 domain-containing protein [Pseudohongiellaceae bacterium]